MSTQVNIGGTITIGDETDKTAQIKLPISAQIPIPPDLKKGYEFHYNKDEIEDKSQQINPLAVVKFVSWASQRFGIDDITSSLPEGVKNFAILVDKLNFSTGAGEFNVKLEFGSVKTAEGQTEPEFNREWSPIKGITIDGLTLEITKLADQQPAKPADEPEKPANS
ncbi:hypothetical protein DFP93_106156 [Aneurinibacillus soli]|uniref:Uncharacterized protein n=2 Tax=Aneurinibacillus soli TaxID=1500254 RepID=A0A0U5B199_9BACL|nr:hypothetical protein [Aneurinibacillus soli]PYE61962.1 hypothetical protein DFP93_106156 [Aneurinibacillus soli]BAU29777.1 hypothetical protein CB4_04014 [Aneurinibacillus soli]